MNLLAASLAAALDLTAPQAAERPPRPEVAVVVVTLDDVRQGQVRHGEALLGVLADEEFGRYRRVAPTVPAADFQSCEDDAPDYGLNFCARFYLHRGWAEGAPPTVVVVFTDQDRRGPPDGRPGAMRALCYGRGAQAANPDAQDAWLWPGSARMHGVSDWNRDLDALAACIDSALAETPGVPRPDPR